MKVKLSSVMVEDQGRALSFYTEVLGFVKKNDIPMGEARWLTVVSPQAEDEVELLLEPNTNPAAKTYQRALFEQGIPLTAFAAENIQLEYERMRTLGVQFRSEPQRMGPTTVAVLDDTCGNLIQLYQASPAATQPGQRPQPLIAVTDVEASSRWYQRLLGCHSAHGGAEYERLVSNDRLILQLHRFGVEHDHGLIGDPDDRPFGNGVLLWFEVDDFDAALARAAAMHAEVVKSRHRNPASGDGGPNHWECWLHDPDGYTVVLASPDGSAGRDK